ncbi:hypothetical protein F5Y19DRAFT_14534 [Xylariaceae sp. FL1651]|nr:hypothetical protein F5Y19DRAFT_14534 [Xylariaceae sp. FL1651]
MDDNEELTVATRTRIAEDHFRRLITQLESGSELSYISIEAATDVFDRFKLWAGNIGARQPVTSPASLEARLMNANRILEQVENLLDDLILALDDLLQIASGSREDRRIIYENFIDDSISSSLAHQPTAEVGPSPEKNESQDVLDVISDCIQSLLKISILIRKATPRDRFAKALQGNNPFIDQFDINYVAERYPKLKRPGSMWLCTRLGRAITKRRQFLRYSREHGSRIAGPNGKDEERGQSHALPKDSGEAKSVGFSTSTQMRFSVGTKPSGSIAAHTYASTKASTLDITTLQRLKEDEANNEDSKSFVSAGSSLQLGNEKSMLHLPMLEDVSRGNPIFECPFCVGMQTFSRESAWRHHAYRDLKAYVCTFDEKKCDSEMFGDSRAWFDHELQCHRKQWMCVLCLEGPFKKQADFKSHAKDKHANVLVDDNQLDIFMSACQRTVDAIAASECPFCDEWGATFKENMPVPQSANCSEVVITVEPIHFRRHVASHMEQLALFAIPRSMGYDEPEGDTDRMAALSRSTDNMQVQSLTPETPNAVDEWIPDPPLHIAAASGDLARFRALLEEGADIHSRGETWGTVLDAASCCQEPTREDILTILRSRSEDWALPDIANDVSVHPLTQTNLGDYSPYPLLVLTGQDPPRDREMDVIESVEHSKPYKSYTDHFRDALDTPIQHGDGKVSEVSTARKKVAQTIRSEERKQSLESAAQPEPGLPDSFQIPIEDRRESRDTKSPHPTQQLDFGYINPGDLARYDLEFRFGYTNTGNLKWLQPPPDNAVPGSDDAPWLQLTPYELAKLRKRMKKNAAWSPSNTMIARELNALGRGVEAFREAQKKTEGERKPFEPILPAPVVDAESRTQHPSEGPYTRQKRGPPPTALGLDRLNERIADRPPAPTVLVSHSRALPHVLDTTAEDADDKYSNPSASTANAQRRNRIYDSELTRPGDIDKKAISKSEKQDNVTNSKQNFLKGILKAPTPHFPEKPGQTREGVASKASTVIPPGARWTKINRKLVSPKALVIGRERFEERDDFVVVLRVLSHEEIQAYTTATRTLREQKKEQIDQDFLREFDDRHRDPGY